MKKLICLLVIAGLAVFTIPAIGATDTELIYSVPSSFEVVIPESLGLNQDYYFEATKMNIRDDEEVYVNCLDTNGITLTNTNNDSIMVTLNGNNGGIVAQFWKGDLRSQIAMRTDAFYSDNTPAGDYYGTTTFSIGTTTRG